MLSQGTGNFLYDKLPKYCKHCMRLGHDVHAFKIAHPLPPLAPAKVYKQKEKSQLDDPHQGASVPEANASKDRTEKASVPSQNENAPEQNASKDPTEKASVPSQNENVPLDKGPHDQAPSQVKDSQQAPPPIQAPPPQ